MFYIYIFPKLSLSFSLSQWHFSKNLLKLFCNQVVGFFTLFKIVQNLSEAVVVMLAINCLYLERALFFFLHSSMCDLSTTPTFISITNENSQVFGFFCVGQEQDDKSTFLKAKSCHPNWSPMNTNRYVYSWCKQWLTSNILLIVPKTPYIQKHNQNNCLCI